MYQTTGRTQARTARSDTKDRVRLTQLLICLTVFLSVYIGRGVLPAGTDRLETTLRTLIASDMDLRHLGEKVLAAAGDLSVRGILPGQWAELLPGSGEAPSGTEEEQPAPPAAEAVLHAEQTELAARGAPGTLAEHYFPNRVEGVSHQPTAAEPPAPAPAETVPAAGTVLLKVENTGQPLPEGYTMDHISFGSLEVAVPVLGRVNSGYGYRDHPIDGAYQFHGGLDIGGQTGDPIAAFAAGRVEYVGENSSYGLYLQLDHGNGIKSFYAHCSSVCVKKGQQVAAGEKIGAVGSSGSATGPHLHLELKYQGTHVDPSYYIETLGK